MEQKRCISVASKGVTREKRKRENGDDEWSTKNIYPAVASTRHQYFISSWCHLKKFTCTTHCAVCQPEVSTAVDDLIWSDDSSSRLAFSQDRAGRNTKSVSEACVHMQFITQTGEQVQKSVMWCLVVYSSESLRWWLLSENVIVYACMDYLRKPDVSGIQVLYIKLL